MSERPTLVRFVNDWNSSSNQVRGAAGSTAAVNGPGQTICIAM